MAEGKRRSWKRLLRLVHSYLSLLGLLGLLFFGATGFFLNHPELFGLDRVVTREDEGALPAELCAAPDKLAIVELLRKDFGALGPLHDFQVDDLELVVMFRRPGHRSDAVIDRETGELRVEVQESGLLSALSQIHKGEDSGSAGGLFIDAVAIILILVALTGFALWWTIPNQRRLGLAIVTLGFLSVLGLISSFLIS